jgi:Spy/CpxP family protein refolding chaperone
MRKLMLLAATVAVLTLILGITTVQAVPGAGDGQGQGQSVKGHGGLFAKLNLTQDQKNQIKTILTKAHAQAKAATDPAAKKAIWKAAFEEIKTKVLTDAQRAELEKIMKGAGGGKCGAKA